MSKKHMFLEVDEETRSVHLVGYGLKLSNTEFDILNIILDNDLINADDIFQSLGGKISKKSIPVHINSINNKAFEISGRKLISFSDKGYHFAKHL